MLYFNPRAPRGARLVSTGYNGSPRGISIHVPREGHDSTIDNIDRERRYISIHVPREGHDCGLVTDKTVTDISIHVPREGHDRRLRK